MVEMISRCGLKCNECGAFKATKADDDNMRRQVAANWSMMYKADIKPEDINCEGCLSTGKKVFSHCNVCEVRKCAVEKDVPNCAHCSRYICEKLDNFLEKAPENRELLEKIRRTVFE